MGGSKVEPDVNAAIVTLLFTDIEGSTEKWEQEPERMAHAVARHDALLRAAVEAHRGRVVKTTGDGVYAAFADTADCVATVIAIQQSVADPGATGGIQLSVRCGLHAGTAHERDNDFFGSTVNRAARIMSLAYGGQVLASQAVADLAAESLPAGCSLRDLGDVRLKGIATVEHVYQVVHPSLRQDFPALRSLDTTPNNLPQQLTSFIGREREIAEVEALLTRTRLLTLVGTGGMGKTRLSLEVAGDVLHSYRDGVWFIDLAPLRDSTFVAGEAAKVLGVREEPGRSVTEALCAHLRTRVLLLIIDNCEHLIQASADLVNSILRSAPGVRIMATSREVLRIPGEQTYAVLPLPLPDYADGIDALLHSPAVRLFVDRARQHNPSFSLDEREAPAVAEIVARLEGIPLALELAAGRVRSLTVADINARLENRYRLLTGGGRVLLQRQQTLRALVAWSYDLLQESEQRLLERLSVFAGGFDLGAVEKVAGTEPLAREDILDLLTSLVEKSLVMVGEGDDGSRYRQLETIREFGREQLAGRGDTASTAARHCDHFLSFAKMGRPKLQGPEQAEWSRRIERDLDNLRAASALALTGAVDPVIAVKIEVALMHFRLLRGYATEGRNNLRAALTLPAVQRSDVARAHALYAGAALASSQSDDVEAARMLETCLVLRRGLGNPIEIAGTLSTLAQVWLHEGDVERARANEEEALEIFRRLGERIGEAIGLSHLGEICMYVSDDAKALEYFEQSLALVRAVGHPELEGECERVLGELALDDGDLPKARARLARSLEVCREAENRRGVAMAQWWAGKVDFAEGNDNAAREKLSQALRAFRAFEMNAETLSCLEDHAALLQQSAAADDAVRLYAAVETLRQRFGRARPPRRERERRSAIAEARGMLGDAAFDAAWADGRDWDLRKAVGRALALASAIAWSA